MSHFLARYKDLNEEQRVAVDTLLGPVMVIAGPGTGKTEVLTLRIANIREKTKTPPEKILALTFTESGATSMRKRLTELIGQDAYRVTISTFHGFANRIIRDYPDYFPQIINATSITEVDQVKILRSIIDELPLETLRPFGDRYYYLKNILHAIEELKRQGVSPTQFAVMASEEKKAFYDNPDLINESGKYEGKMKTKYVTPAKHVERNGELAEVYAAYQKALLGAKQYDYSDMIMYVAEALERDEALLRVLQEAYEFFLVDEHQDTNDAQNKIIELIVGGTERPNLFVVGDEKQAIFRFQGASIENFNYFRSRYKNVALITLRNNYRSTQAILNTAQGVSPREVELVAKAGHAEVPAYLVALSTPDAETFFIAEKAKELIAKGVPPHEIAILFRDNKDASAVARMLEKQKVPFIIESDQDVLGDEEIKKLMRLFRAVEHFGSDVWLSEALHVDFLGIPPIDVYKLFSFAAKKRSKAYDVLRSASLLAEAEVESVEACQKFFYNLSEWKRLSKNKGASEVFETVVRDSGFLSAILNNASATEKLAKLHVLFDLIKSFVERKKDYRLEDFFKYLDVIEEHGVAIKSADTVRIPGRVRLMTAHRSKGQEFEYVFVVQAVSRKWGMRTHRESIKLPKKIYRVLQSVENELADGEESDADERNVFYVALTRARKQMFLTYAKTDRDGKEQLPTQFIAELKEDILAPLDVASYEKEFAGHRDMEFLPTPPKAPELKDKEFLNAIFMERGISVTALNNYIACPWRYFYRNLIRIPEAPNKHLSFGNAIHAALKSYFDAFGVGDDKGKDYLIMRFEEEIAHEPIPQSEYEEALLKGKKGLSAFYDEYHASWSPKALNEAKVVGVTLEDGTPLNGKLDRVEFLEKTDVRVIDYKTGKPKTRNEMEGNTKSSSGDYKRQLVFYKLLLDKEAKYVMTEGVIQFVEPDLRGKFHREVFQVMPLEVLELEAQIRTIVEEIKTLAFWDRTCDDPECEYCELRKGMR